MSMKKVLGLAVLVAAFVLVGASSARAATAQELQDQINALLAQISSLQGGSSMGCYSFTRDLTVGSQGADVTALQNYLAAKGYFNVAATGYFGSITASAVASWQSANGVMPAAGYFGPISRAKYNSVCGGSVPPPIDGDDDDDDDDDDDNDFGGNDGEEASLEDYQASDGDDTDLEEGGSDQEIMEFEFDVEDADVEVQRVEVVFSFEGTASGEEDPWKVFEGARLWMDGEEVAESDDLSDEDNWSEESGDNYSFRFNGVDTVVNMDETAEFVLSVDVQDGVDGANTGGANDWDIFIDDEGIRALDEAGIDQYTGENSDIVSLSLEEAGGDDELSLSESDNDVDAGVLEVDDSGNSDWQTIGIMELSADMDIELKDFIFQLMFNESGANDETYDDVINDLMLVIDGEEYDDFDVTGNTTATATVTFDLDDEDLVIEDGDDVEVEVMAEFRAISGTFDEGTTVTVNASSGLFEETDAEGVDSGEDLDADQLSGSYEGEEHTLRNEGIAVVFVDENAVAPVGGDEAQASYEIEFTVESFGADFFIEKTAARDATGDVDDGVNYIIENGAGTEYASTSATVAASLSKTGSTAGDTATHYKVAEGQTRTFTLSVTLDNEAASAEGADYYRLQMTGIAFDADGAGASADFVLTTGLDEFETDEVFVDDADVAN